MNEQKKQANKKQTNKKQSNKKTSKQKNRQTKASDKEGKGKAMTEQEVQDVYERQAGRLYKICCFYLGNPMDAQDAVQTIFIRLLEKRITFQDAQHEDAWFYTVARNLCRDMLRSGWRRKRADVTLPVQVQQEAPAGNFWLEQALQRLPVKQKEVLYLYYYEGYAIREISKLLNRKESTIQTQLAAGRAKLKKQMNLYMQGGVANGAKQIKPTGQ